MKTGEKIHQVQSRPTLNRALKTRCLLFLFSLSCISMILDRQKRWMNQEDIRDELAYNVYRLQQNGSLDRLLVRFYYDTLISMNYYLYSDLISCLLGLL